MTLHSHLLVGPAQGEDPRVQTEIVISLLGKLRHRGLNVSTRVTVLKNGRMGIPPISVDWRPTTRMDVHGHTPSPQLLRLSGEPHLWAGPADPDVQAHQCPA